VQSRGVGLRLIKNGRIGFSATTDLSRPERLVERALHSAQFGQEAKFDFPKPTTPPTAQVYDPAVVQFPVRQCVEIGKEAIDLALNDNSEYKCSIGIGKSTGARRLMNSAGLDLSCSFTSFGMHMEVLLVRGESLLWVGEGHTARRLDTDIRRHAETILRKIHQSDREIALKTEPMSVIFVPKAVGVLLGPLESGVNGKVVQKGASPLAGSLGEKILDERISIYDDPTVPYAPGTTPFDGEGIPTGRLPLFEGGALKNYIFDLQTAGLMGAGSTGSAKRGYGSQPAPGLANVVMMPGKVDTADMIAGVKRGIIVDQVLGAGQSNTLAGEFSVNIDLGFLIEDGEIRGRIKDCMVAGNVFDTFNRLAALSRETEWHGGTCAPAVQFDSLTVAGKA